LRRRESFVLATDTRNRFRFHETWNGPLRGFLFGLAPDGVFPATPLARRAVRSYRTFSPLPQSLRIAAVCFSVALSVGGSSNPPPAYISGQTGVTWHRTRWCSDFPPLACAKSDSPSLGFVAYTRRFVYVLPNRGSIRSALRHLPKSLHASKNAKMIAIRSRRRPQEFHNKLRLPTVYRHARDV